MQQEVAHQAPSLFAKSVYCRANAESTILRTPSSTVHWTLALRGWCLRPLEQAMHVEHMGALAPNCSADQLASYRECGHILSGQSSPGTLQAGQHASKGSRQIPQTSSSSSSSVWLTGLPVFQRHSATACQDLIVIFIARGSKVVR